MTENVRLVVIYNHKFCQTIPQIHDIYKERFSNIVYLVPFFDRDEKYSEYDIIGVYESSYCFQGYIAQAKEKLMQFPSKHYIFIGDDVILNPDINEKNYCSYFGISEDENFITEICKLGDPMGKYSWSFSRVIEIVKAFKHNRFIQFESEIPEVKKAFSLAKDKGYENFKINVKNCSSVQYVKELIDIVKYNRKELRYPIFAGYSDIIVICGSEFQKFANYCGVFAAMHVFVEAAIPTAMVLACKNIVTEKNINYKRGDMWGMETKEQFGELYKFDLNELFNKWSSDILFYHPIKLSRWR